MRQNSSDWFDEFSKHLLNKLPKKLLDEQKEDFISTDTIYSIISKVDDELLHSGKIYNLILENNNNEASTRYYNAINSIHSTLNEIEIERNSKTDLSYRALLKFLLESAEKNKELIGHGTKKDAPKKQLDTNQRTGMMEKFIKIQTST